MVASLARAETHTWCTQAPNKLKIMKSIINSNPVLQLRSNCAGVSDVPYGEIPRRLQFSIIDSKVLLVLKVKRKQLS